MGPFDDEQNPNTENSTQKIELNDVATQKIDSQFLPGDGLDGDKADDDLYVTSTMPVDDAYLLEDIFETQLLNLAGETQVLNDLDSFKSFSNECLDEFNAEVDCVSDSEGVNKTQPVFETQEICENDHVNINGGDSVDIYSAKRRENVAGAPSNTCSNEDHSSGSVCGGFTSMRVASIRASGLAAEARKNTKLLPANSDKSSLENQALEQDGLLLKSGRKNNEKRLQNECNEVQKELRDAKKSVVCRAARKLFTEDNLDMPEFSASENCLAGLSYADSQEPGELSQAHALEVVDKFLHLNAMELDEAFHSRVHIAEKPVSVFSLAKGSRDLAKRSTLKSRDGEKGVYDWDDTREDDGGGEFFSKKKEFFFGKGGAKQKSLSKSVEDHENKKAQKFTKEKSWNSKLHKLRAKGKSVYCEEEVLHKNLAKDFDDVASRHKLADNGTSKDFHDMAKIGPDTQMAAEAMETLCFENVNLVENNFDGSDICANRMTKATRSTRSSNRTARPEQNLTIKLPCSESVGVVTRQAKQIQTTNVNETLSSKQYKNTKKGHHTVPVARRTRKCADISRSGMRDDSFDARKEINDVTNAHVMRKRRTNDKDECPDKGKARQVQSVGSKQPNKACQGQSGASDTDEVGVVSGKRTRQETLSVGLKIEIQGNSRLKRSRKVAASVPPNPGKSYITRSRKGVVDKTVDKEKSRSSADDYDHMTMEPGLNAEISAERARERCATPTTCTTKTNKASPICMGDEYHTQSCRKMIKELESLEKSPRKFNVLKHLRKRKDITDVRVLFSQHLDENVVKRLRKILARMGGAVASSMSDATHFVADEFVRTRNMLEAIALGKPVITHLWLDSCGQANCLVDEKNHILRDARKEKEIGFCLPDSLSRACQHPLLQGMKVLVTPNTKPGTDVLANLVKAVHGLAVERLGRSVLKDEKLPDDLLILSCEEDYDICLPYLEKGGNVYSSELLLNGIVKQKLEYERHRLFVDHVKRTRSTIRVKKNQCLPASKCK